MLCSLYREYANYRSERLQEDCGMAQGKRSFRLGSEMLCYKTRKIFSQIFDRESWIKFPSEDFYESMFPPQVEDSVRRSTWRICYEAEHAFCMAECVKHMENMLWSGACICYGRVREAYGEYAMKRSMHFVWRSAWSTWRICYEAEHAFRMAECVKHMENMLWSGACISCGRVREAHGEYAMKRSMHFVWRSAWRI
jgi:hypothetical protein